MWQGHPECSCLGGEGSTEEAGSKTQDSRQPAPITAQHPQGQKQSHRRATSWVLQMPQLPCLSV